MRIGVRTAIKDFNKDGKLEDCFPSWEVGDNVMIDMYMYYLIDDLESYFEERENGKE